MNFINNWMRDDILKLQSYAVQDSGDKLKMDAMESPFLIDKDTKNKLLKRLEVTKFNRYPANHTQLKKVIKELMTIDKDLEIMLGNGSDELIQILLLACNPGDIVLGFKPSFVMYNMIAKWCSLKYHSIHLTDDFEIDVEQTLDTIQQIKPKIIFIAYPNNPTGNSFQRIDIEKIINNTTALVVIDEAYYAYCGDSFILNAKKYDNLVILRTVSKIGFAGLRLGVMVTSKALIKEFNKLRMPYNINTLTQVSAEFLLSQKVLIKHNAKLIKDQRSIVFQALSNMQQTMPYKSDANFILFKAENAIELFNYLMDNNIVIKNMDKELSGFLRVTISTKLENQQFLTIVQQFYG